MKGGVYRMLTIKEYCAAQQITYLTTLDFLYYAYIRGKMSKDECDGFILEVNAKGSKLPTIDISQYSPNTQI